MELTDVDLRRAFFSRGMKLLSHPTVASWLASPRAMDAFVTAVRTKERIADALAELRTRLLHAAGLASVDEVRDLKTVIRELERAVRRIDGEAHP